MRVLRRLGHAVERVVLFGCDAFEHQAPCTASCVGMRPRFQRGENRRRHDILDLVGIGRGVDDDAALRLLPGDGQKRLAAALVHRQRLLLEAVGRVLAAARGRAPKPLRRVDVEDQRHVRHRRR